MAAAGELREAYIRILLTRGVGELSYDLDATPAPSLVIIVKPLEELPARVDEDGITHLAGADPPQSSRIGEPDHQVEQPAEQRHGDAARQPRTAREEALMCNYRGELAECAQTNFFLVRDGRLLTPPSDGRAAGRHHARLSLRPGARGGDRGARGSAASRGSRRRADEAFITGTTRELSPVVRIDERVIGSGKPGPITLDLLAALSEVRLGDLGDGDAFGVAVEAR